MLEQRDGREPLDRVFHALADPSRMLIVERLSRGPASVSELARPLPMSLPAVVQHIQVLETSGLVRTEKVGRVRTCEIEPAALQPVEQWISARRSNWERRLDRLGDYLAGGWERRRGMLPDGREYTFEALYRDIVRGRRIVYTYEMLQDGVRISVSVATAEFKPDRDGTRLVFTEQAAFLEGHE